MLIMNSKMSLHFYCTRVCVCECCVFVSIGSFIAKVERKKIFHPFYRSVFNLTYVTELTKGTTNCFKQLIYFSPSFRKFYPQSTYLKNTCHLLVTSSILILFLFFFSTLKFHLQSQSDKKASPLVTNNFLNTINYFFFLLLFLFFHFKFQFFYLLFHFSN